jgi:hypothetical protein
MMILPILAEAVTVEAATYLPSEYTIDPKSASVDRMNVDFGLYSLSDKTKYQSDNSVGPTVKSVSDLSVYMDTTDGNLKDSNGKSNGSLIVNSDGSDYGTSTTCYDIIYQRITNIKIKSGGYVDIKESGLPEKSELQEEFGTTTGIYWYYTNQSDSNQASQLIVSCDYNAEDKLYCYVIVYVLQYGKIATKQDDFAFLTLKSKDFFLITCNDTVVTNWSGNTNMNSDGSVILDEAAVRLLLESKYDKEAFQQDFNGQSLSSIGTYTDLNEYITWDDSAQSIMVSTPYTLKLTTDENTITVQYEEDEDNPRGLLKNNVSMPKDIELDDFIDFGDTSVSALTSTSSDDTSIGYVTQFFMGLFCDLCETDVSVSDFKTYLPNFCNLVKNCAPDLGSILGYYADEFVSRSESTRLSQEFGEQIQVEGDYKEINSEDSFIIMSFILGYNIYCAGSSSDNFNSGKYIVYGSDKRVYMYTNWTKKDTDTESSIKDIWDSLTSAQQDLLGVAYSSFIDDNDALNSNELLPLLTGYVPTEQYSSNIGTSFASENSNILDTISETVNNRDSSLRDTNSVYNVARNCNTLVQYLIGTQLYGVGSEDSSSIYNIYDQTLASILESIGQFSDGLNDTYWPLNLPDGITLFGSNMENLGVLESTAGGLSKFVCLLYDVSYAFDVAAFSEGGEENKYDPAGLREYFKGGDYSSSDSNYVSNIDGQFSWFTGNSVDSLDGETLQVNGDEVSINMLRSIIELHDLCEFLDILNSAETGGWTTAIQEYLGIYSDHEEFFNELRNNPYIYTQATTGESSIDEPLGIFFNIEDKSMSDQWCKGFAVSALYVPLETNLYDAESISYISDTDFISDFYYKYAFYRKALYINTDNSAIVNAKVSGEVSGTRVATLRDLLNYDRDIILTVDDNFYNAKDISSVIGSLDYTAVRNGSSTNTDNTWDSLKNWVGDLFDLSAEQILKTGSNTYYSSTLANSVTKLGGTPTLTSSIADVYVLSDDDLIGENSVFNEYEYSVKQSYGVVSAVYRSAELYNECLRALASDNAIFKSSKAICSTPGTTSSDWRSIYNYCMLANLEDQMKNDSASALDLDAPIFCDLFGNIITESGLVIIPAACNATLCGTNWNPNTVGWSEYYNNGNKLVTGEFSDEVYEWLTGVSYESNGETTQQVQYISGYDDDGNPIYTTSTITASDTTSVGQYGEEVKRENAGGYMIVDRSGVLTLRTSSLSGQSSSAIIQWENLNKNSTIVKELFYNDAYFNKAASGAIYSKTLVNLVVETLRGAPIEYIDYDYEGLSGATDISKAGVYMAYKLEELTDALVVSANGSETGGNSIVTIPNLAFVTGIEYIVLYVFKVVFALMLVGLAISLYLDAVKNHLGIKSVGKFIFTCMLVLVVLTVVPNLISWSYYKANKQLLASESGYIMMLNYVKSFDGAEIGITSVTTPETTTELYVKLDDVSVNWWEIISEVLFNNTYSTVTELYESQLTDNAMALQDNVELKGDGLYMNVQSIFDSTSIVYYPTQNQLSNIAYSSSSGSGTAGDKDSVVSFTIPYYVFLDKLVANIDEYNTSKDITAYSWDVGSNGHIMTYDIISPYLTSSEFLDDGYDILGLNEVLQTGTNLMSYTSGTFTDEQISKMKQSRWYPTGTTEDDSTQTKINEIYEYARNYIAANKSVLGKIPDEVFLKVFALQLSIKFNQVFNIHTGNAIEIMNIDTRDIIRLMIADRGSVYKYYSYSFARFAYEESGTIGVILTAFYLVLLWLTSMMKPICLIIIIALLLINSVFRKVLFRKDSKCVEGYLIGCACLVMVNYAYAGMLKLSLSISEYGFGSVLALTVGLLTQIAYIFGLCGIVYIEIKDWQNNGFSEWAHIGSSITSGLLHAQNVIAEKILSKQNNAYGDSRTSRRYSSDDYDSNSVDDMLARDEEREENGTYSPI